LGPVYLYASTLTLTASSPENSSVPSLSMNRSSTVDGSGVVTVTGPFTWQESYVVLSGTLTAAGGIALQPGYSQLVGTHLVNQGRSEERRVGIEARSGRSPDNGGNRDLRTEHARAGRLWAAR